MADLIDFIPSITIGTRIAGMTKKNADGVTASGYSAFVTAITGENPTIVDLGNNKARLILTKNQVDLMQRWLDRQTGIALKKKEPSSLEIDLKPVFIPWALKYAVPVVILFFLAGWLGHYYVTR